ncbi:hypothetical protein G7043_39005 [Lentzea sp. NEAU-D13]|uniref:Uncharacterized protein n=1 Tax=Lentzea alba TaxID=2714351 RepID=A0A7C9W7N6_9PSEU|nr:hypothetical protein [Lentzea alba]NGY64920.1 hypothetical protein [Lentzea alba]
MVLIADAIVTLALLPLTVDVATGGVLAPATSWTWSALGVLLLAAAALGLHGLRRGDRISARFPDHPQLVVSSRERDYDRLATRLRMHGAVVISPLNRTQEHLAGCDPEELAGRVR